MLIDPDIAHSVSRHLMAAAFIVAAMSTIYRRRFGFVVFYILATVETYARIRYPLHIEIKEMLTGQLFELGEQRDFQLKILIASTFAFVALLWMLAIHLRKRSTGYHLLVFGSYGVLALVVIELISHHSVDAFIYQVDFIFVRSSWLYATFALTAAIGAAEGRPDSGIGLLNSEPGLGAPTSSLSGNTD